MRAVKILTLTLITVFSVGNVNSCFGKNLPKVYTNVIRNDAEKSRTVSVFNGEYDRSLKPIKQYTVKFNDDGNLIEKIQYQWDTQNYVWKITDKYNYIYGADGKVETLTHAKWNENAKTWSEDTEFTLYMLDIDKELLTINENF